MLATGANVADQNVIRVGQPEAGRGRVSVQERERGLSLDDQVVFDAVLCLDTILNEDSVSLGVIVNVADDSQVLNTVQSCATVDRVKEDVVHDVGLSHDTVHVEMDWVATGLSELADTLELNVADAADVGVVARGMDQNMSTILVHLGTLVTLENDISLHKSDFSANLNRVRAVGLNSSVMLKLNCFFESNNSLASCIGNGFDNVLFSLVSIEAGRCDHDLLTDLPVDGVNESNLILAGVNCSIESGP